KPLSSPRDPCSHTSGPMWATAPFHLELHGAFERRFVGARSMRSFAIFWSASTCRSSSWKCPMLVGGGELSAEDWMRKVFSVTDSKAPSGLLSDMNKTKRGGGSDQEERPPTFHPL
ncbi:unnamed protein product, partial [Durusdinium trenchii]